MQAARLPVRTFKFRARVLIGRVKKKTTIFRFLKPLELHEYLMEKFIKCSFISKKRTCHLDFPRVMTQRIVPKLRELFLV